MPVLSYQQKSYLMMLADALILSVALWLSVVLRWGDVYRDITVYWWLFPIASIVGVVSFHKLGLYQAIVRYIGASSIWPVIKGISVTMVVVLLVALITIESGFPRSAPMIFWFISIIMVGSTRVIVRAHHYGFFNNHQKESVIIYGAGESGAQLAAALLNGTEYVPAAFVDDKVVLRRTTIHGIRVYDPGQIGQLIDRFNISRVLLAIPSATQEQRSAILNRLSELPVQISTVQTLQELINGNADVSEIHEVDISDLLGRDMVPPDRELLQMSIEDKSVMVTGAGGTIGSELCRKILVLKPRRLVLLDNSELALYNIEQELREIEQEATELVFLLGSVLSKTYLSVVMENFSVQTVYHAAAYKHVPMVESNVIEGVRNNVLGTWYVAESARKNNVGKLVLISTDKAVRASSVMGASKRLAELVIQAYATSESNTQYCMVRFGNVLGSSGSILPLFKRQIEQGGPVTVTHKDANRFFMTESEAAELVIQAGAMSTGGELFILDMGEPVRVREFAEKMIHLHGKKVGQPGSTDRQEDFIDIVYTGLRPGEKLKEELIISQGITGTRHPKILQANEDCLPWDAIQTICSVLQTACEESDYPRVRQILEQAIPGYTLSVESVDPIMLIEQNKYDNGNIKPFRK